MKRVKEFVCIILSLLVLYVLIVGVKQIFKSEKAYIKYGDTTFHSVPICPKLGVDEAQIEYIEDYGEIVGIEEVSHRGAWNDITLEMCEYCYSQFDIKNRDKYLQQIKKQ